MIKFEMTKAMRRKVATEYALRKLRYPALFAVSLGVLVAWVIMPDASLNKLLLVGLPLGILYAGLLFISYRNKSLSLSQDLYDKLDTNILTYEFDDKGIKTVAGDVSTFIPYRIVKKAWSTKQFQYLEIAGGRAIVVPMAVISKSDSKHLESLLRNL